MVPCEEHPQQTLNSLPSSSRSSSSNVDKYLSLTERPGKKCQILNLKQWQNYTSKRWQRCYEKPVNKKKDFYYTMSETNHECRRSYRSGNDVIDARQAR